MPEQLHAEHSIFVHIKLTSWVYKRCYIYGWFGDRIPVRGGEIFRTRQTGRGTHVAYDGYMLSLPGLRRRGRGVEHPPPSIADVKERAPLYLFFPVGPSWPVMGWTFYVCVIDGWSGACVL